jgi:hypothetical protein
MQGIRHVKPGLRTRENLPRLSTMPISAWSTHVKQDMVLGLPLPRCYTPPGTTSVTKTCACPRDHRETVPQTRSGRVDPSSRDTRGRPQSQPVGLGLTQPLQLCLLRTTCPTCSPRLTPSKHAESFGPRESIVCTGTATPPSLPAVCPARGRRATIRRVTTRWGAMTDRGCRVGCSSEQVADPTPCLASRA